MENNQKDQQSNQQQPSVGEQNPTLNQPGTQVADYGNVTGGSANESVEQEQNSSNDERSGSSTKGNETMGNP
jgi:hypothetical protein